MTTYLPPPASLPPGSRVWAYLRESGGPGQGESIDRQRTEIEQYCTRHGLVLAHVFYDTSRSGGSTTGREEFDDLIYRCTHPGAPVGLLLWDFARFSRSLDDSGYYKAVLRKHGLVIHSLTDAVPEGVYGRVVEIIIDIANEEKRRQLSRDVASGLRRIVEQYGAMPGKPPTGYQREKFTVGTRRDGTPHILNRWVVDPAVAPLVRMAFEMRAARSTFRQITKATGLFHSKTGFSTFFNNTIYKGELWFSGRTYPCEAIVSDALWDKVQELGELRNRERYTLQHPRRLGSDCLLSGLVYCQECGAPLYGYNIMHERLYYVCSRSRRRHDCPARNVRGPVLEAAVIKTILDDVLTLENVLRIQASIRSELDRMRASQDQRRDTFIQELSAVRGRIARYIRAIGESGHSRALSDALLQAEQERDRLELELEQVNTLPAVNVPVLTLQQIVDSLRARLIGHDQQAKKQALRETVQRLMVHRGETSIQVVIEYTIPGLTLPP